MESEAFYSFSFSPLPFCQNDLNARRSLLSSQHLPCGASQRSERLYFDGIIRENSKAGHRICNTSPCNIFTVKWPALKRELHFLSRSRLHRHFRSHKFGLLASVEYFFNICFSFMEIGAEDESETFPVSIAEGSLPLGVTCSNVRRTLDAPLEFKYCSGRGCGRAFQ